MRLLSVVAGSVLLLSVASPSPAANPVKLENCSIEPDEQVQVPAQEPGVLVKIPVRDGDSVAKGALLAQIDDIVPQMKHKVAFHKLEAAKAQAEDDANVQFARAGYAHASATVKRTTAANNKTPGTKSEEVVAEEKLEEEKFRLSIQKELKEQVVARAQVQVSTAELQSAAADVERRRIISPLDAVVVRLYRHEGEWVNPGDPVVHLLRVDRLRVEGILSAKDYLLSEIEGRPVEVVVTLAHARQETFPGKIVFVNPLLLPNGRTFTVRAEVENRQQNGVWVLSPGLNATMTIQLK
jgi:multidrug efflux pump subunit AcrA (membrane-fusion protein)